MLVKKIQVSRNQVTTALYEDEPVYGCGYSLDIDTENQYYSITYNFEDRDFIESEYTHIGDKKAKEILSQHVMDGFDEEIDRLHKMKDVVKKLLNQI